MTKPPKRPPDRDPAEFLPLTELWFNILLSLSDGPRHGYAIIQDIERHTDGAVSPATGTMYLALQRLEQDHLIIETEQNAAADKDRRKRRYYKIAALGRRVASLEAERLARQLSVAMNKRVIDRTRLDS